MDTNELIDIAVELILSGEFGGICTACNEIAADGVEPDAEGYACDSCGAMAVCGAELFLLMNVA
jgi:hypothetical protein